MPAQNTPDIPDYDACAPHDLGLLQPRTQSLRFNIYIIIKNQNCKMKNADKINEKKCLTIGSFGVQYIPVVFLFTKFEYKG